MPRREGKHYALVRADRGYGGKFGEIGKGRLPGKTRDRRALAAARAEVERGRRAFRGGRVPSSATKGRPMLRRVFEDGCGLQGSSRSYDYDGQHYRHVGRRPHDCADGRPVEIDIWVSKCATCGAPFEVSRAANSHRKFSVNRRCPLHRRPGVRVNAGSKRKLAATRAADARREKERLRAERMAACRAAFATERRAARRDAKAADAARKRRLQFMDLI